MGQYHHVKDKHSLDVCIKRLQAETLPKNVYIEDCEAEFTGSMPMHRLWWAWMEETAEFMRQRGVFMPHYIDKNGKAHGERAFTATDAHDLYTTHWLGTDEEGRRWSWKKRTTDPLARVAPKSKRLYAMEKHQAWATERGLKLLNPENSEFRKLQLEQEE